MLTAAEIITATQGRLAWGKAAARIKSFSTDSRKLKRSQAYIAIEGKKHDGHKFIQQVIKKGCKVLIVHKTVKVSGDVTVIHVKDTTRALGNIAAYHRSKFSLPVVAITGSAGKTTTKEFVSQVLSSKFKVLKNYKNENNQYGVPFTLLRMNRSFDICVIEVGTNQPGDIDWLGQITKPDVAVFTNIGESHLSGLKSPRGVFEEKLSLLKYIDPKGTVIFNADDSYLRKIAHMRLSQRKLSFGINRPAGYRAVGLTVRPQALSFKVNKRGYELNPPIYHNVYNALIAITCGELFTVGYNNIRNSLKKIESPDGRNKFYKFKNRWIIDDAYNSNPVSFRGALKTLDQFSNDGAKFLVCADMFELGAKAVSLHKEMGLCVCKTRVDHVFSFGPLAKHITDTVKKKNKKIEARHFNSLLDLHRKIKSAVHPGDCILVKGSRGMKMDRTVDYLKKTFSEKGLD